VVKADTQFMICSPAKQLGCFIKDTEGFLMKQSNKFQHAAHEKAGYQIKHPEVVCHALFELINELQFWIETEPNAPDIEEVKAFLQKAQDEYNALTKEYSAIS